MDTVPQPEDITSPTVSPITPKNIVLFVASLTLAISLPITMWVASRNTYNPSRASNAPLGSVHINPEVISTDINGPTIYLSTLAFDTSGLPIEEDVTYQWGMSSTNSIGTLSVNTNDKLASFTPSKTNRGRGDIWVKAFTVAQQTTFSIPVYVGVQPTPTPTSFPTPTVTPTPTPYMRLTQPNGGEQVTYGQPYIIKWNAISYFDSINIFLINQQGQGTTIAQQVAPTLTQYTWNVNNSGLSGGSYKIEIHGKRGAQNPVIDTSDNFFTMVGIPAPTNTPSPTNTPLPTVATTPTNIPTPTRASLPTATPTPTKTPPKPNTNPTFTTRLLPLVTLRKPYLGYITAEDADRDAMTMTISGLPNGLTQGICTSSIGKTAPFKSTITCTVTGMVNRIGVAAATAFVKDARGGSTKQTLPIITLPW